MSKNRKTFAEYYGLTKVEDVDERKWVAAYLHSLIKSEVNFDFAPLKQGNSKLYVGPNGFQASVINEGSRLEHDLIGRMYADGAQSVYMYFWDPAEPLDAERIFYIPRDYDHGKFEEIFDSLHFAAFGGLVDNVGKYCFIQVMESVSLFWAPRQEFDRLIGDWHWSEYRSLLSWRERDADGDIAHISQSQEMLVEGAAINAVQEYWRKTSFEPPASPAQQPSIEEVLEKYGAFNPNRPERLSSVEKRLRELADATGLSEEEIQSAFKGNVLDMGRILGLTKKKRDD